ncbi:hypothetical protein ONE63_001514 [Megalurothrips usitatus]|uniref:Calcineurin-like phosphoesterase domain-containing protein n=1 Tax=Megalurothrips usitatus TaxID=439358 RepID=A0AAV7XFG2_9NEOP|nr:hypothetical protein ONE63_001514 [Megalurothrips usitatus]
MKIEIHKLSSNPTQAWAEVSKSQRVVKIHAKPPKAGAAPNKVRIVCMSDTHSLTPHIKFDIPYGDIFIHAGDFTRCGSLEEVVEFNEWIGKLPHKHKIVIAGNHELSFDESFTKAHEGCQSLPIPSLGLARDAIAEAVRTPNTKQYLTNCTYLEDEAIIVYGIKIYGSPWQPEFCNWAFNVPRGEPCLSKWERIPEDTDILITHTPPIGHGDLCCTGVRAGCVELLSTVQQRVKPKYHVFGHIHEGYGITSDGQIIFINASTCDINYLPTNPPIVFDISMPHGMSKD